MPDERRVAAGKIAAARMKNKYGPNYFVDLGSQGGRAPHSQRYAFAPGSDAAKRGGRHSRKGYTFIKQTAHYLYYYQKSTGKVVRVKHVEEQS